MSVTWTEEQQKVIDLRNRNILVSAAAGSGKTAVLVERMISMVTDTENPIDIDQLLVVTFTKAAAAEMKERIGRAIEKKIAEDPENDHLEKQSALLPSALITTIDSFCLHVIRNHFNEIDLDPSFRVADETELALLKSDTMEKLLEDMYEEGSEAFHEFVEGYARGKTDQLIEDLILQVYEYSRSYPWPDEWLDSCIELMRIDSVEDLKNHPLMISLMDYVRNILKDLLVQLKMALDICCLPDGPVFYNAALEADIEALNNLLAEENFFELQNQLSSIRWTALSRKKMPDASDEQKDKVKAIRDSVKKYVKDIKNNFFFTDVESMLEDIRKTKIPMEVLIGLVKDFSERFQNIKEEKNIVDFGDLEHFALNILVKRNEDGTKTRSDVAIEMSQQFAEVMCDEYQDSNLVQETILNAVSKESDGHPNIFMVGDVKQSIYKFRQARPELFMEKYHDYPVTDGSYQRIDLHKNFRSRKCVVDFVNLIFEHIMGTAVGGIQYDENAALNLGANFPEYMEDDHSENSGKVSLETEVLLVDLTSSDTTSDYIRGDASASGDEVGTEDDLTDREMEAKAIAGKIRKLMAEGMQVVDHDTGKYRPVQYRDMVILLRSMKGWSDVFTDILMSEDIPAHSETAGGFFDTLEIRTAVSILSVIDNPIQDIELAATLKSCVGGFSDEELAMIRTLQKKGNFYDACQSFLNVESDMILGEHYDLEVCQDVRRRLDMFFEQIQMFRQMSAYMSIHQLIRKIFEQTGYDQMMSALPMGEKRLANLELFIEKAVSYEQTSYRGLFNFVRYISRLKTQNTEIGEASVLSDAENVVRIISIHKSKGLEYPVVFVSGMNKSFNSQDVRSNILLHPEFGLGPEAVDLEMRTVRPTILKKALAQKISVENLSEELRILYVALTRAKERLIITASVKNLDKKRVKWEKAAECATEILAYVDLVSASGFLDWMMPVLLNQLYRDSSDANVLIETVKSSEIAIQQILEEIDILTAKKVLLDCVNKKQNEEDDDTIQNWTKEHLLWQYPFEQVFHIPSKMTISEIKKMYGEDDFESEKAPYLELSELDSEEDSGETSEIDVHELEERIHKAALRGSGVHKIMELLDFTKIRSLSDVEEFINQCVMNHQVSVDVAEMINPWKIFKFVRCDLGKRMTKAQINGKLHREHQFIMAVGGDELFGREDYAGESVLTQGIIDAWFEEDGHIVLVDYKTDSVAKDNGQALIARYHTQLEYYQKALERSQHMPVTEKYIYAYKIEETIRL